MWVTTMFAEEEEREMRWTLHSVQRLYSVE